MTLTYQNGFAVPSDVPLYVAQPRVWPTGGAGHIIGDGVGTRGSPMPLIAAQLADIPSTATGWLVAGDAPHIVDATYIEPKFRAHANISHIAPDDPIRNFGQPGASHLHQFFGNVTTNAFSTFASLRNRANALDAAGRVAATTAGGPYNATGYWIPAMMKGSSVVKPGQIFIYYTGASATQAAKMQRIPRGLRYVFGCNMEDPDDTALKAELAAANAVSGTNYAYTGNGFSGWGMLSADLNTPILTNTGQAYSPYFVNPDGSDPWAGMGVTAGCYLKAFLNGPAGIDGTNMWSPGGYAHVTPGVRDNNTGQPVIYNNWYWIPQLQVVPFYRHNGWNDYKNWTLSSDAHASMVAGRTLSPGESFHGDWLGAWHDAAFGADTGWQIQCIGAKNGATPYECASGCVRQDGTRLLGSIAGDNAPNGSRTPQLSFPEVYDTNVAGGMYTVPSFSGTVTVAAHAS